LSGQSASFPARFLGLALIILAPLRAAFELSGELPAGFAATSVVVLRESLEARSSNPVAAAEITNGRFRLRVDAGPGLFNVEIGDARASFVAAENQSLSLTADGKSLRIAGAPDQRLFLAYEAFRADSLARKVTPARQAVAAARSQGNEAEVARLTELEVSGYNDHRRELNDFTLTQLRGSARPLRRLPPLGRRLPPRRTRRRRRRLRAPPAQRRHLAAHDRAHRPLPRHCPRRGRSGPRRTDSRRLSARPRRSPREICPRRFLGLVVRPLSRGEPPLRRALPGNTAPPVLKSSPSPSIKTAPLGKPASPKTRPRGAHISDLTGWKSPLAAAYNVAALPASFLLDPTGKIVGKDLRGAALAARLETFIPAKRPWNRPADRTGVVAFPPAPTPARVTRSVPRLPSMPTKILAVDDAKVMRQFIQRTLAGFDCDLTESTNGYNALFAMERSLPDLILLDVNMPIMNGVELLEMLKSKPELTAIPVIMLASPADHAVLPKIRACGVTEILMKPISEPTLLAAIQSAVALKPRQST